MDLILALATVIGALIGLTIAFIDYRLSVARWNRYVAGLEVRFPTAPDGPLG